MDDNKKIKKDSIAILGLGKVGTAVGYLLNKAGYHISAVAGRSKSSLQQRAEYTGGMIYTSFAEASLQADCILLTTADDAIATVCETITKAGGVRPGQKVIHMSGAGDLDLLQAAKRAGAHVGCIHPLQSFADVEGAINSIPGSTFAITVQEDIRDWSVAFVHDIGGLPFFLSEDDKPLYHVAACMASGYLTTLIHTVEEIYCSLGLSRDAAIHAFWPLVRGTLKNIETKGAVSSLTGPFARGDITTIRKHIRALSDKPAYLDAYCSMGILALKIGIENKTLPIKNAGMIEKLLKGDVTK